MKEQRYENRLLCADIIDVQWRDKSGWTRRSQAVLEDISGGGACLQTESPVPLHTRIGISHAKGTLWGEVRYCVYREIGYFVGITFPYESRWTKRVFCPKHLFDVRLLLLPNDNSTEAHFGLQ